MILTQITVEQIEIVLTVLLYMFLSLYVYGKRLYKKTQNTKEIKESVTSSKKKMFIRGLRTPTEKERFTDKDLYYFESTFQLSTA